MHECYNTVAPIRIADARAHSPVRIGLTSVVYNLSSIAVQLLLDVVGCFFLSRN